MEIFIVVLVLLISIVISNVLSRFIPFLPVPLIQISTGILLGILPLGIHMPLEPELFMVLFIAPLLYNDGKMTSREELWKIRSPILLMALGLVLTTVIVIGYVINWLIPGIPLSACFALAAILSPTDAVAVSSLSHRIHLPEKVMRLIEGEALMNDASGLVAFKFAVAATVTGEFSFAHASASFFIMAAGGLLSGAIISFVIIKLSTFIRRLGLEDATFHVLMQIITPFVIYLVSEELGVSGILAVVAGGIIHTVESDYSEPVVSKLKLVSRSTWSVILFILNGLIFLILGLQIPKVMSVIFKNTTISNFKVLTYVIVISTSLLLLRFIWVYIFSNTKWRIGRKSEKNNKKLKQSILTSLSGVRGAVTLAGAFSLPYYLDNGQLFPERDLIIFIAAGVILFTVIIASVVLPILSKQKNKSSKENTNKFEYEVLKSIIDAAINVIKEETSTENRAAAASLISNYKKIKNNNSASKEESKLTIHDRKIEKDIFALGLKAEHNELQRLLDDKSVSEDIIERSENAINKIENQLSRPLIFRIWNRAIYIKKIVKRLFKKDIKVNDVNSKDIKAVRILTSEAAITAIKLQINDENRKASIDVIEHYKDIIRKLRTSAVDKNQKNINKQKTALQFKAIQAQRNQVQLLLENNEISRETANKIRGFINYIEATAIEEEIY